MKGQAPSVDVPDAFLQGILLLSQELVQLLLSFVEVML